MTEALILIGVTLSLLGSTRPGSGSEHHLSHFFEIVGLVRKEPHFPHGTDVAYATVLAASMRERISRLVSPEFVQLPREERLAAYRRVFGPLSGEVQKLQEQAQSYEKDRTVLYREKWNEVRLLLSECPAVDTVIEMFTDAGYEIDAFEAMYGKEKIHDAMFWGKDLKDRYSVLWLYFALFAGEA